MDWSKWQSILPFLGGLLGFAGAIITFINSRLNEAKTPQSRSRVIDITISVFAIATALGTVLTSYVEAPIATIFLAVAAYFLNMLLLLRRRGQISRFEVVALSLLTSIVVTDIGLAGFQHGLREQVATTNKVTTALDKEIQNTAKVAEDTGKVAQTTNALFNIQRAMSQQQDRMMDIQGHTLEMMDHAADQESRILDFLARMKK